MANELENNQIIPITQTFNRNWSSTTERLYAVNFKWDEEASDLTDTLSGGTGCEYNSGSTNDSFAVFDYMTLGTYDLTPNEINDDFGRTEFNFNYNYDNHLSGTVTEGTTSFQILINTKCYTIECTDGKFDTYITLPDNEYIWLLSFKYAPIVTLDVANFDLRRLNPTPRYEFTAEEYENWTGGYQYDSNNKTFMTLNGGSLAYLPNQNYWYPYFYKRANAPFFYNCGHLVSVNAMRTWDLSNVTDLLYTFCQCFSLTDISGFGKCKTCSVKYLEGTFYKCSGITDFSPLNYKYWKDVNAYYYMHGWDDIGPFGNTQLKSVPYKMFASFSNISGLFENCKQLTNIKALKYVNLNNCTALLNIFNNCTSLIDISPLSSWNLKNGPALDGLFNGCLSLKDISPIKNWDLSNVKTIAYLFYNCQNISDFSPISNWNTSAVTTMEGIFYQCYKMTDCSFFYNWDFTSMTTFYNSFNNTRIKEFNLDFKIPNNLVSTHTMFGNCSKLETVNIEHLKSYNCTSMFANCTSLRNYTHNASFDLSRCNTIAGMFQKTTSLTFADLSNMIFDDDVTVNMSSLFAKDRNNPPINGTRYLNNLSSVTFNNTFKPTYMNALFQGSVNIENTDSLSAITDTSKCITYDYMFDGCLNLTNIDYLSGLSFESCDNISGMFEWCKSLSDYSPMLNWDLTKRKNKLTARFGISELFYYNYSLTTPMAQQIISTLSWGPVNGGSVFCNCIGLNGSIDLANLSFDGASYNSDNHVYGAGNFCDCSGLTEIKNYSHLRGNISDHSRDRSIIYEFSNCINLSALTNANIDYVNQAMFNGCQNIADWSFIPNNVPFYYPNGWTNLYGPFVNSSIDDNFISRISPFSFNNSGAFPNLFSGCPNITTLPTFANLNNVQFICRLANLSERQKFTDIPFTASNYPFGLNDKWRYLPYMDASKYITFLRELPDMSSEASSQTNNRKLQIMSDLNLELIELINTCLFKHYRIELVLATSNSTQTEITDVLSSVPDYSEYDTTVEGYDYTEYRSLILNYNYGQNKTFCDNLASMMRTKHWKVSFSLSYS